VTAHCNPTGGHPQNFRSIKFKKFLFHQDRLSERHYSNTHKTGCRKDITAIHTRQAVGKTLQQYTQGPWFLAMKVVHNRNNSNLEL
jgi:hypothetical protein